MSDNTLRNGISRLCIILCMLVFQFASVTKPEYLSKFQRHDKIKLCLITFSKAKTQKFHEIISRYYFWSTCVAYRLNAVY